MRLLTMWRVTVNPIENRNAWKTYKEQGVIAIGWCSAEYDTVPEVLQFKQINPGDWVVAHVPKQQGGGNRVALGLGKVISNYEEVPRCDLPNDDDWQGSFRRQYRVEWYLKWVPLNSVTDYYRGTIQRLAEDEEREVLRLYKIDGRFDEPYR